MGLRGMLSRGTGPAALAAVLCLLVFLPALTCGFVNLDDPDYVLNNSLIRQLDAVTLAHVFTKPHAGFWMPLTWLSFAVDYQFWGLNPLGYHLTNNVLHAVNTGLVVLVADSVMKGQQWPLTRPLATLSRWERGHSDDIPSPSGRRCPEGADEGWSKYSYPVSLLFFGLVWGIHPLRVESVVWVTERKDVLNGLFALSSVLFYLRYIRQSEVGEAACVSYLFSLLFFSCSLMAKPVTVVLPLVLLVLDWYPFDRVRRIGFFRIVNEKLPFLACSVAVAVLTLAIAEDYGMLASHEHLTFLHRFLISGNALFEYGRLMVFPAGIMPLHIIDLAALPTYGYKTAAVIAGSIILCCYRGERAVVAAGLCFILLLLPVLGFFQNGLQAFAARFTYLPSVAPTILVCCLWARACKNGEGGRGWLSMAAVIIAAGVVVVCAVATIRQIGVWKSTETVWSRVIEIKPSGRAYKERGMYHLENRNYSEALEDLTLSLEFARRVQLPEIYNLHAYRGAAFLQMGRYAEASVEFGQALGLCRHGSFYYLQSKALEGLGHTDEAADNIRRAGSNAGSLRWLERDACD